MSLAESRVRGAALELGWRLSPMSCQRLHRLVSFLLYRQPICHAQLQDDDCSAMHSPEALRAVKAKTGIDMCEKKSTTRRFATFSSRQRKISTEIQHL